jgi:hypothetical protein
MKAIASSVQAELAVVIRGVAAVPAANAPELRDDELLESELGMGNGRCH